jgi:REP element-mobilizing transposase RayT
MSRKARMLEPGDIHHVMSHGIDSLNLFETETDCQKFLTILKTNFEKYECHCYGFILMKNHYHLLIRPSGNTLSPLMRVINNTFARYINKTRKRRGYVFFDRFKSIPTRDINYVKKLILYIHANPLRAQIVSSVEELGNFVWSSHIALMNKYNPFPWLNRDYIAALFSSHNSKNNYLNELTRYVKQPKGSFYAWKQEIDRELPELVLPSEVYHQEAAWVRKIVKEAEQKRIMREKLIRIPNIIQKLLNASCDYFSIKRKFFDDHLYRQTRTISSVVKLFSYWAIEVVGFSGTVIGRILQRSNTAVLRAATLEKISYRKVPFPI